MSSQGDVGFHTFLAVYYKWFWIFPLICDLILMFMSMIIDWNKLPHLELSLLWKHIGNQDLSFCSLAFLLFQVCIYTCKVWLNLMEGLTMKMTDHSF